MRQFRKQELIRADNVAIHSGRNKNYDPVRATGMKNKLTTVSNEKNFKRSV